MGTGFRDIVLRLTEAAIAVEDMKAEELVQLLAEAARTIQELRDDLTDENRLLRVSRDLGADASPSD